MKCWNFCLFFGVKIYPNGQVTVCYQKSFTPKFKWNFAILRSDINKIYLSLQTVPLTHRKNLALKLGAKIIYMFQNNFCSFITSMLKTENVLFPNVYIVNKKFFPWCTPRDTNCIFHAWHFLLDYPSLTHSTH